MKTLRQQNRPVITYVLLRGKYVAFVLMGEHFRRSPAFSVPEAAQRWAMQMRQEGEITS